MSPETREGADVEQNIAHHLLRQSRERPHARAVVLPRGRGADGRRAYAQLTYGQLNALTDRYAWALRTQGVRPGDRVLILVSAGFELVATIYAVFKVGGVAVFIDPGMGLSNLVAGVSEAAPRWFVGVARVHMALTLFGRRALRSLHGRFRVGAGLGWGALDLDRLAEAASGDAFPVEPRLATDEAAVLFTSGSTGPAKGVLYEHGMFQAQVKALRDLYGLQPGEIDLPGLPVFSLFSVALGATTVFPDMDPTRPAKLDPALFVECVRDHGVTYSFGSPAIWGRVSRYCVDNGIRLPSLQRVLMAGAPVPPALHERLAEILEGDADTHTPYGATEVLPVATSSGRALAPTFAATRAGAGTCVGRPLPDVQVKVIAITDAPLDSWDDADILSAGQRGEIIVTGPAVTRAYCARPEATRAAKIIAPDGACWHRMGDMGYFDDEGRLWFLGRKSHRVETQRGRLYPVACEAIFNEHPRLLRSALVGVGEPPAQRPAIVVEPLPGAFPSGAAARETFARELLELGAAHDHTAEILDVLFHRAFPVDLRHNAKIRRGELAAWATKALS